MFKRDINIYDKRDMNTYKMFKRDINIYEKRICAANYFRKEESQVHEETHIILFARKLPHSKNDLFKRDMNIY